MSATSIMNTLPINTDANVDVPTDELDRALQNLEVKQRKPRKTKQRDPDAPKRPASAYMLWLNDNRAAIKDELLTTNPDAKITDVTKRAGELWKSLSDDEKAPFQTASEELRAKYHEAMKAYKPNHVQAKKTKPSKFDIDATPDAPDGWSGPFDMKYLYRKVKDSDGKHVRIQKSFDDAVALANDIITAWNHAKDNDTMPPHWDADVKPCAGITKTSTGYDLRLGPHLMTTAEKDKKGGMASWIIGLYNPSSEPTEQPPKKKRGRKPKSTSEDEAKVASEDETKVASEDEVKVDTAADAKVASEDEAKVASAEAKVADEPTDENTSSKPKKIVKKVLKKKTAEPKPTPVDIDQCQEIELERDGQDVVLLLHEDTGKVYHPDNLVSAIGKADEDGVEFF